jgi:hypothetical protein
VRSDVQYILTDAMNSTVKVTAICPPCILEERGENELFEICNSTFNFTHAHTTRRVSDLPMKVRHLDTITIHEAKCANPGACEICCGRASKPSCADDEDFCVFELELCCPQELAIRLPPSGFPQPLPGNGMYLIVQTWAQSFADCIAHSRLWATAMSKVAHHGGVPHPCAAQTRRERAGISDLLARSLAGRSPCEAGLFGP